MPPELVLDASALLALLNGEPGADVVAGALPGAWICSVNLAEVVGKLAEYGMPREAIAAALGGLGLRVAVFDEDLAWRCGLLRPATRKLGLSLGDRACLALAEHLGMPALTADRAWLKAGLGLDVELIR